MLAEIYGAPSSPCCKCTGNVVRSASSPVSTTPCTGACAEGTSIGATGCRRRSRRAAGKPGSSVSSAAASRRRVPITLPTSSAFSGPTAWNQTARGLQSSTAATSMRSIGSSWTTHSPCCTSFSTKWRKRNFSVSVMKMLSSRSHAACRAILAGWPEGVHKGGPLRGTRCGSRRRQIFGTAIEIVDAVPAVVVDQRLEFLEAHALVTQREGTRAHVLEHDLHRLGRVHDGFEAEADRVESELLEFLGRENGGAPADQRIGELRHVETARDAFELLDALRRLHEDRLCAGVDVALGAPQRLVEAEHGARVGAHADERLGIKPLRHGGPDLGLHDFRWNDLLAGHMTAALGPGLVLEKDRARTHPFVGLNRVHGVLDVAVTVVDIDQNRHIAGRDDVAHGCRDVGEALEADVGHAIARTGDREAADEHGVESGPLDQQRAQRIVGAGNDEQSPLRDGSVERLPKTSSTAHGGLLLPGSAGPAIRCRLGVIGRHGAATQLMQKAQHLLVRHVLALVIAIIMNDLVEGASDGGTAVDGGKADRQDVVDHQEIGHAEHALERLLDVDGDV